MPGSWAIKAEGSGWHVIVGFGVLNLPEHRENEGKEGPLIITCARAVIRPGTCNVFAYLPGQLNGASRCWNHLKWGLINTGNYLRWHLIVVLSHRGSWMDMIGSMDVVNTGMRMVGCLRALLRLKVRGILALGDLQTYRSTIGFVKGATGLIAGLFTVWQSVVLTNSAGCYPYGGL